MMRAVLAAVAIGDTIRGVNLGGWCNSFLFFLGVTRSLSHAIIAITKVDLEMQATGWIAKREVFQKGLHYADKRNAERTYVRRSGM